MNKIILIAILITGTISGKAQSKVKIISSTLKKIESYSSITHLSDQKWGNVGDPNDFTPLQGKCTFWFTPADTVIGAYYSLSAGGITDNYDGNSLSRLNETDSTFNFTDLKTFPKEKRGITSKMLYTHSIVEIYNKLKDLDKNSSRVTVLKDTTINKIRCKRISIMESDTVVDNAHCYFQRIISISGSTYLPLHCKTVAKSSYGVQIIECALSNYRFNEPLYDRAIFTGNKIPEYFKRIEYKATKAKQRKPVLSINQKAPYWELETIKGDKIMLENTKGKVVLLEFSGVHCGYCLVAVKELKEIYKKFDSDKFQLLSVYSDEQKEKLKNYVDRYQIDYPVLFNGKEEQKNQNITEKYGVSGIPHFILIDKKGIVSNIWIGFEEKIGEAISKEIEKQISIE